MSYFEKFLDAMIALSSPWSAQTYEEWLKHHHHGALAALYAHLHGEGGLQKTVLLEGIYAHEVKLLSVYDEESAWHRVTYDTLSARQIGSLLSVTDHKDEVTFMLKLGTGRWAKLFSHLSQLEMLTQANYWKKMTQAKRIEHYHRTSEALAGVSKVLAGGDLAPEKFEIPGLIPLTFESLQHFNQAGWQSPVSPVHCLVDLTPGELILAEQSEPKPITVLAIKRRDRGFTELASSSFEEYEAALRLWPLLSLQARLLVLDTARSQAPRDLLYAARLAYAHLK